jgi:diaminopimelate epimerase
MTFSKWSALGNVYLLAERAKGCSRLIPDVVRELCRDVDGLVEIVRWRDTEAQVVIWNRDGSTAEFSGNGTRIAACWLAERVGVERVVIRVGARAVTARMLANGEVQTDVGEVLVLPAEVVEGIELVPVSVGNPHAVVLGEPDAVSRLGPILATHAHFAGGTNVEVARVEVPGRVTARIWERGVGETQSSGTGAVAVAAATHPVGEVAVRFPGGVQNVRLADGRAWLTGPAERL